MSKELEMYSKELLIYFIKKHPHFNDMKLSRKSQDDLINILIENDILCIWDNNAYDLCSKKLLQVLCDKMIEKCKEFDKEYYVNLKKNNKKAMIEFLCGNTKEDIIFSQIKNCLRRQENIEISKEELYSYL